MSPKKNNGAVTGSENPRRPVRPRKCTQDVKGAHDNRAAPDKDPQIHKCSQNNNQGSHHAFPSTEEERDYPPVFYSTSESSPLSAAQSIATLEDDESGRDTGGQRMPYHGSRKPALHVVVLGPTGGPREDRVTGILVRSAAADWAPNTMVAVDAGTLLAGIIHVIEKCRSKNGIVTSGPFVGLRLPYETNGANAKHVFKKIIGRVLITHPHLDHVSALAMNIPTLTKENGPKTVAALPSVVDAMKTHIFNNLIWPNFSDEDEGIGLITYQRLADGGNPMLGSGEEQGYTQAGDGMLVRGFSVSHGRCKVKTGTERRRQSISSAGQGGGQSSEWDAIYSQPPSSNQEALWTTVESSAFFLRDQKTGVEIIIFGDVEPDSVSLNPRNRKVWETAAPKVASGTLRAIFIECSYVDSTEDIYLFGHLCPRHLVDELSVLAARVADIKGLMWPPTSKRKRDSSSELNAGAGPTQRADSRGRPVSIRSSSKKRASSEARSRQATESSDSASLISERQSFHRQASTTGDFLEAEKPLVGLSVYVIHVKELLHDGPDPAARILEELKEVELMRSLGCDFHIPRRGESIYL
ncbi:cAMP phosphodiesterases class-II-domain-containing protein [Aspergillus recurvatus]